PVAAQVSHFEVGDASPRLRMERGIFAVERASGQYPIWTRNLPSFQVRCAPVPEAKLAPVLTGPANYDSWWDASSGDPDYKSLGLTLRQREVKSVPARNRWVDHALSLGPTCGGGPSAVYLVQVGGGGDHRGRQVSLVNVTDLGLLAKVGNASSLVWVVRLSTGAVVPGALVKVRDLAGKVRFSGKTNDDGVVMAPGASKLIDV